MQKLKADILDKYKTSYELQYTEITNLGPYLPLLAKFQNLKYLSLKGNKIQYVTADILKLKKLVQLDLSQNPIKNVVDVIELLKELPKLRNLFIDVRQKEEKLIINRLDHLQYLNGKHIRKLTTKQSQIDISSLKISIQKQYLLRISEIFDKINDLFVDQEDFTDEFRILFQNQFKELTEKISFTKNKNIVSLHILKTKSKLEQYCTQKFQQYISNHHKELYPILENLFDLRHQNIKSYHKVILNQAKQKENQQSSKQNNEVNKLINQITNLKVEIQQLNNHIKDLEKQNSVYLDRIINFSKGNTQSMRNIDFQENYKSVKLAYYSSPVQTGQIKVIPLNLLQQLVVEILQSKLKTETISKKKTTMNLYIQNYFQNKFGKWLADANIQNFKQSLINYTETERNSLILFTKILYNQCQEQYYYVQQRKLFEKLFRYFIQFLKRKKYQDRQREIVQLEKIFQSRFYNTKSDIFLEQKEYFTIIKQLYETQQTQFLLQKIKGIIDESVLRNPLNTQSRITNMSPSKRKYITKSPISKIKDRSLEITPRNSQKVLSIKQLINIILNYELKKHLMKIQKFTEIFRSYDKNNNGMISQDQFKKLILNSGINQNSQIFIAANNNSYNDQILYSIAVSLAKRKFEKKSLIELLNQK